MREQYVFKKIFEFIVRYAGMENTSSFYSIGLLAISLAKKAKESKEGIQKNNAQKSIETQLIYQEGMICPLMMLRFSLLLVKLGVVSSRLVTTDPKVGYCCSISFYYGWMFGLFKRDPAKKLQKQYEHLFL